jgi:hypothetical protein
VEVGRQEQHRGIAWRTTGIARPADALISVPPFDWAVGCTGGQLSAGFELYLDKEKSNRHFKKTSTSIPEIEPDFYSGIAPAK